MTSFFKGSVCVCIKYLFPWGKVQKDIHHYINSVYVYINSVYLCNQYIFIYVIRISVKKYNDNYIHLICLPVQKTIDVGLIPGSGRSPGGGHGYPFQYSCLENPWTEEPGRLQSIGSQSRTRLKRLSTHTRKNPFKKWLDLWQQFCSLRSSPPPSLGLRSIPNCVWTSLEGFCLPPRSSPPGSFSQGRSSF